MMAIVKRVLSALMLALCLVHVLADEPSKPAVHHTLTWSGNDGTPKDSREPVFVFDGKAISTDKVSHLKVPQMHLKAPCIVDVLFPEDAKIHDPDFAMPLEQYVMFDTWVKAGITLRYHYREYLLPRHILILRMRKPSEMPEQAEVSLDGKTLGVGPKAFDKLDTIHWESPTFMTIRIIHEYPQYPQLPGFGPPDIGYRFDQPNPLRKSICEEFSNDTDPWRGK